MKKHAHPRFITMLVLAMTLLAITATGALADDNKAVQPQVYTYTLMPAEIGQQPQVTNGVEATLMVTADQVQMLNQSQPTTTSLGTLVLNGTSFSLLRTNNQAQFKTDAGFISFSFDQQQTQAAAGIQAVLTLSVNYDAYSKQLRTTEQSQQQPITFAWMQVNGVQLALMPQAMTDVTQTTASAANRTIRVNEAAVVKQKETELQAPTVVTAPSTQNF